MLMKVQIPTEARNKGIKDGTLPDVIRKTLETLHPEAAYFATMGGQRTMIAVFDMKAAADIGRRPETERLQLPPREMKAARSPLCEAGGTRRRAPAGAEGAQRGAPAGASA
jgi:hypothetical protein